MLMKTKLFLAPLLLSMTSLCMAAYYPDRVYGNISLDSAIWIQAQPNYKFVYKYNWKENTVADISYRWDAKTGTWSSTPGTKNVYGYDDAGNKIFTYSCLWNRETGTWKDATDTIKYIYDTNNRVIQVDNHGTSKTDISYNEAGHRTATITYKWNSKTQSWDVSEQSKTTYTYDEAGRMIVRIDFYVDNTGIAYDSVRTEYTYDEKGNNIEVNYFEWQKDEQSWGSSTSKDEYKYDEDGRMIQSILSYWEYESNSWRIPSVTDYSYDDYGNKILHVWHSFENPDNIYETVTWYYNNEKTHNLSQVTTSENQWQMYNILGQPINDTDMGGIIIRNGKKYVIQH